MKIKHLSVTVKYRVGLGRLNMPKKVYEEIDKAMDNGHDIDMNDHRYPNAADWLADTIQERDCMDWNCEVDDLQVQKKS